MDILKEIRKGEEETTKDVIKTAEKINRDRRKMDEKKINKEIKDIQQEMIERYAHSFCLTALTLCMYCFLRVVILPKFGFTAVFSLNDIFVLLMLGGIVWVIPLFVRHMLE